LLSRKRKVNLALHKREGNAAVPTTRETTGGKLVDPEKSQPLTLRLILEENSPGVASEIALELSPSQGRVPPSRLILSLLVLSP